MIMTAWLSRGAFGRAGSFLFLGRRHGCGVLVFIVV
jgi:hypothetical protein